MFPSIKKSQKNFEYEKGKPEKLKKIKPHKKEKFIKDKSDGKSWKIGNEILKILKKINQ